MKRIKTSAPVEYRGDQYPASATLSVPDHVAGYLIARKKAVEVREADESPRNSKSAGKGRKKESSK